MRTLPDLNEGHLDLLKTRFEEIKSYVMTAACAGRPAHEVELGLWRRVLDVGHQALGLFFALQGTGDVGDTLTLSDGRSVRRLEGLHERTYQSVFGSFTLRRIGYGSREGQKIDCVPPCLRQAGGYPSSASRKRVLLPASRLGPGVGRREPLQ